MTIKVCYNRDTENYEERFGILEDVEIYDVEIIEAIKRNANIGYGGYDSVKRNVLYYLAGYMSLPVNTIVQAWYCDKDENWHEIFDFRKMWKAVREREREE